MRLLIQLPLFKEPAIKACARCFGTKRGTKGKHFYTHISFSSLFATDGDERCKNTFTHMCFCFAKVLLVFALSPANFCALLPNTIHMHVHMYVCVYAYSSFYTANFCDLGVWHGYQQLTNETPFNETYVLVCILHLKIRQNNANAI